MALENDLNEISLKEKSESEGVAEQLFDDSTKEGKASIDLKTNLADEEIGLCLVNDAIFKIIGMEELSPTAQFKRLVSSRGGWKTNKFVETATGVREGRESGLNKLGSLFRRREE